MNIRAILVAVWFCFVVRVLFYCAAFPLWEGFDEYAHFAVIQNMAFHPGVPDLRSANSSREVADSLRLAPWPWLTHNRAAGFISYDEYWSLSSSEREDRQRELRMLSGERSDQPADPPLPTWEAQQPPAYYWLAALQYRAMRTASLPQRVWILRCVTALIASTLIPLAYLCAREMFSDRRTAAGIALVAGSFPELLMTAGRVGNEGLAIALGSLTILLALRLLHRESTVIRGALFGVSLGLALLTKAYFLAFLPAVLVVLRRRVRPLLIALATIAAIAGWWYLRNLVFSGTITGEEREVAVHAGSTTTLARAIREIAWIPALKFVSLSHIWLGGWSFLVVRTWMYRMIEASYAGAVAGAIFATVRPRDSGSRQDWILIGTILGSLLLGLAYHATTGWRTQSAAGTMGYYLYCATAAEAILLVGGLGRLVPQTWRLWPIPFLVTALATIEIFGAWFLQFPYYAGMIRHNSAGALPALPIGKYGNGGFRLLFENLSANKPALLNPGVLMAMGLGSIAATLGGVAIAFALSRERSRQA